MTDLITFMCFGLNNPALDFELVPMFLDLLSMIIFIRLPSYTDFQPVNFVK